MGMSGRVAMQKVEGSSPFIRFEKPDGNGGFFVGRVSKSVATERVWLGLG